MVAVKLLGPKTWHRIAQFVPGRTQVQCRERWANSLDPSLNWDEWTNEEDSRLEAEVEEYEYCWSMVSRNHVPPRTDNQCWRRWKVLFPHKVPLYRAFVKVKRLATISNFVGREAERPALGANDFLFGDSISAIENENSCEKQGKKSRRKQKSTESLDVRQKKLSNEVQPFSEEASVTNESGTSGVKAILMRKKRVTKPRRQRSSSQCPRRDIEKSDAIDAIPKEQKSCSLKNQFSKGMQDPLPNVVALNQDSSNTIVEWPDVTSIASNDLDSDSLNKSECGVRQKVIAKQLRTGKKSVASPISEVVDDDMTLAFFLCNRRKRRKLEHMKSDDAQASLTHQLHCGPYELFSGQTDQYLGKQLSSL